MPNCPSGCISIGLGRYASFPLQVARQRRLGASMEVVGYADLDPAPITPEQATRAAAKFAAFYAGLTDDERPVFDAILAQAAGYIDLAFPDP